MISPQEQQLLRPNAPQENRRNLFISPLFIILACVIVPPAIAYALSTTSESAQVAAMVLGLLAVGVVIAHPFWGLVLFIGLIYIRPEDTFPELAVMRFTLIVSFVTLIGTLIQFGLNRERFTRDPLNLMIFGFGVIVVISTIFSSGMNTAEAAENVAKLVVLVLLVLNLVRTPERYRTFVSALIMFSCYLAGYAIYMYLTGQALVQEGVDRAQATGIFGDPNDLAATTVAGLGLALGRVMNSRGAWRVVYGVLAAVMLTAIISTNSRGGLLALIAVLGGFFVVYGRRKALATALAIIVGFATFALAPSRMSDFADDDESANSRFAYWDNGFNMLKENPISGVGYGQFEDRNNGATAHNSYVLCFAELGLPGYFVWMGCIFYAYKRKRPHGITDSGSRDLSAARLALTGMLTAAFWISRTYIPILYVYFALATAAYLSARPSSMAEVEADSERRPIYADWAGIAMACVGMMVLIQAFIEHYT